MRLSNWKTSLVYIQELQCFKGLYTAGRKTGKLWGINLACSKPESGTWIGRQFKYGNRGSDKVKADFPFPVNTIHRDNACLKLGQRRSIGLISSVWWEMDRVSHSMQKITTTRSAAPNQKQVFFTRKGSRCCYLELLTVLFDYESRVYID